MKIPKAEQIPIGQVFAREINNLLRDLFVDDRPELIRMIERASGGAWRVDAGAVEVGIVTALTPGGRDRLVDAVNEIWALEAVTARMIKSPGQDNARLLGHVRRVLSRLADELDCVVAAFGEVDDESALSGSPGALGYGAKSELHGRNDAPDGSRVG